MAVSVSIGEIHSPKTKYIKDTIVKVCSKLILLSLGFITPIETKDEKKAEEVYKKYLGKDYKISYDKKYGSMISNHVSWIESFYGLNKWVPSYIGKSTTAKVAVLRMLGRYNKSLYIDRTDHANRQ